MAGPILKDPNITEKTNNKAAKQSLLDRNVGITFNLRKFLKTGFFILLILGIFMLGRFSAGGDFGITGFATSVDAVEEEVEKPVVEKEPVVEEKKEEVKVAPKEEEDDRPEKIIKEYNYVYMSIDDVEVEWKETWGRIKKVQVTIDNKEEGTIKLDHLVLFLKGYDDIEKEIPLPGGLQEIKSGKALQAWVTIPGSGISYNEKGLGGSLNNARITLNLIDHKGKNVITESKTVSLQG